MRLDPAQRQEPARGPTPTQSKDAEISNMQRSEMATISQYSSRTKLDSSSSRRDGRSQTCIQVCFCDIRRERAWLHLHMQSPCTYVVVDVHTMQQPLLEQNPALGVRQERQSLAAVRKLYLTTSLGVICVVQMLAACGSPTYDNLAPRNSGQGERPPCICAVFSSSISSPSPSSSASSPTTPTSSSATAVCSIRWLNNRS